jgi:uncharacterized protein (DUF169 family)
MSNLDIFHHYGEELERRLRLATSPMAIKLLKKGEKVTEGAKRPLPDLGHHLSACQGFSMSRRQGIVVAMLKEDMWCPEPVISLGFAEPPQYFLDGHNRFPGSVATLEAGSTWAREFPRLKAGDYAGIVSAPLTSAPFEPDVVVIYGNPAQVTQLVLAAEFKDGRDLTCTISGRAACVYAVVPVIQSGKFQVSLPCPGDRQKAAAQDDEIIFSAPKERMAELMEGLRARDEHMRGQPTAFTLRPEYALPESYVKIAGMMGMNLEKKK